jgi:hypothetical protein
VCITPDLLSVRTPLLFLRGTLQSTDILTAVGLVIVPVGAAQPATGSIRGAVRIIASGHERLWGEVLVAGILREEGAASPAPATVVVLDHVVARIGELDLLGQAREGDLGAMRLEVTALMDIGRVRGRSHEELQAELDRNIGGLVLQEAKDAFCVLRVLVVDVVSSLGFEIGGALGAAAPQLPRRALGEVGPLAAQGRELVWGQGEPLGELLGPGRRGTVSGQRLDVQERHFGLTRRALLGGRLEDLLDHLGEGAAECEPFGPRLELSAELVAPGCIPGERLAVLTGVSPALEPGGGGLQLAICGEQFSLEKAKFPEEAHKDGEGGFDGRRVHAAAAVAQIIFSRNGRVQTSELAIAAALLLRA